MAEHFRDAHVGPLDGTARPGTIGLPLPDTDVQIVDVATGTRTLPHGEVGELIVRGPQVMLGYWNNPDETARRLRDGWLYTGDFATCDGDLPRNFLGKVLRRRLRKRAEAGSFCEHAAVASE